MKNAGVLSGIVIFFVGCLFFWGSLGLSYSSEIGPGPGLFPFWLSLILIVITPFYIWEAIKKDVFLFADVIPRGKQFKTLFGIVISPLVFMVIVPFTGFCIAGIVLMLMLLLRYYKWYLALSISVVSSIAIFLLFQIFLDVPLPVNAFGW